MFFIYSMMIIIFTILKVFFKFVVFSFQDITLF